MTCAPSPRFFGQAQQSRTVGPFTVTHSQATVPADDVPDHVHDEAHFVFVTRGAYVSSARGGGDPLLVYNPAQTEHRDHFAEAGGWFLSIAFDARWAEGATDTRTAIRMQQDTAYGAALNLLRTLHPGAAPEAMEARCWELLARADQTRHPADMPRAVHAALEIIHESRDPGLSVSGIAAEAGIHPAHLSRAFRRQFGRTPSAMLQSVRMERAIRLVSGADMSLGEVALETGYFDQSHMTNAFTRALGVTPASLRRDLTVIFSD
ncbi:AraC family transcriptional regulator [Brevundimonas sp.]|uniref:helix-turn-helix transcriptional regulator n=1 Tax=Brevundimonas sp. TaxID=1871086 RepID=UPI003AF803BF